MMFIFFSKIGPEADTYSGKLGITVTSWVHWSVCWLGHLTGLKATTTSCTLKFVLRVNVWAVWSVTIYILGTVLLPVLSVLNNKYIVG